MMFERKGSVKVGQRSSAYREKSLVSKARPHNFYDKYIQFRFFSLSKIFDDTLGQGFSNWQRWSQDTVLRDGDETLR